MIKIYFWGFKNNILDATNKQQNLEINMTYRPETHLRNSKKKSVNERSRKVNVINTSAIVINETSCYNLTIPIPELQLSIFINQEYIKYGG
jgi:hypothetical protein